MKTKFTNDFYSNELKEIMNPFKKGNIIGLDMSLTGFGLVVLNSRNAELINKGVIKNKNKGAKRLVEIRKEVKKAIVESENVKLAVIEGYAYGRNVGRFFDMGELGGVIKQCLYLKKIPYIIISPLMLKKWITGSARGDKSVILMKIFKKFKVELEDNNIGDAYVLARIGYVLNKMARKKVGIENIHSYQEECIKTIIKKRK